MAIIVFAALAFLAVRVEPSFADLGGGLSSHKGSMLVFLYAVAIFMKAAFVISFGLLGPAMVLHDVIPSPRRLFQGR